jgi:protein arginine N-methyltransferase 5
LESGTYEVFEQDPVKYQLYEDAIKLALIERNQKKRECIIFVVGAGRGPLVERARRACRYNGQSAKVYCIEKNPNAIITYSSLTRLKMRKELEWDDNVIVVHADIRFWTSPEKCDILISELLGSLGDNELSPECLDGAQKFLKGILS